ncbi:unnamed protein product [Hyaloperonospora brassicae]|uniref:Uncharacterized protein n=1 Tax=Hyaloperonospora brassicae TaxID=162125 RepID=A0AAV0TG20_HYABA|nr:unnamed protein product [Hyaloperonospora brassicae]
MADGDLWRDRNKVFVAGLPPHVDDNALYEKFQPFGAMHQSKVVSDPKTGRSRGFGFVTFCDYTNALDAVDRVNQTKWDKRVLNVRFLQPKGTTNGLSLTTGHRDNKRGAPGAGTRPVKAIGPRPEGCTTVYVGNLAYGITEEVLRKVFDKCGSIRAVRFAEHIQTKEFRGFGYVQFHEEGPCEAAIKLDGMVVMGRPMTIDYGARDEGFAHAREELQKKLKKGICHKFQQGQCTRGDACKFAHVMQGQDAEELVQPAERPVGGIATPGAALLGQADTSSWIAGGDQDSPQVTSDAPICINFRKGKCKRGAACKFQHLREGDSAEATAMEEIGMADVQTESEVVEEVLHEQETMAEDAAPVCQNYQKSKCKRGAACRFRHVTAPAGGDHELKGTSWKAPVRVVLPVAAVAEVAVCRNFQSGMCSRGASCRFAHTGYVPQTAPLIAVEEVSEYQKRFQSVCYNWQRSGSCARGNECPFQHDQGGIATSQSKPTGKAATPLGKRGDKEKEGKTCEADDDAVTDGEEVDTERSKKHKKSKKDKKRKADEVEEADSKKSVKDRKKSKKRKVDEGEDADLKKSVTGHKKSKKDRAEKEDGRGHDTKEKLKKDKKHKKDKKDKSHKKVNERD